MPRLCSPFETLISILSRSNNFWISIIKQKLVNIFKPRSHYPTEDNSSSTALETWNSISRNPACILSRFSADETYEEPFVSTPRQPRLWSNDRSSDRDTSLSNFLPQFGSVTHYHPPLTRPGSSQDFGYFCFSTQKSWNPNGVFVPGRIC